MKRRVLATLVLTLGLAVSASAQSIGVFWDQAGAVCSVNQPSGTGGTMYILALLGGPIAGGITGAEFRVDNFPPDWFASANANPNANVTIGGPLTGGTSMGFQNCQVGSGGVVLLYTVPYFATDTQVNREITVLRHTTPSNTNFQCPVTTRCDSPTFTKVCVSGGRGVINGGSCTVAVEPRSWSSVKQLFH